MSKENDQISIPDGLSAVFAPMTVADGLSALVERTLLPVPAELMHGLMRFLNELSDALAGTQIPLGALSAESVLWCKENGIDLGLDSDRSD